MMDAKELKSFLKGCQQKKLASMELDYCLSRIGYLEYLNRCYAEYCKAALPPSELFQKDHDAIYD